MRPKGIAQLSFHWSFFSQYGKINFILLAVGVLVIILGFILMSGSSSTETTFNPEIFSATRIKVAPIVCVIGFVSIIFGIMKKPNSTKE